MAFENPHTFTTGEVITAANLNAFPVAVTNILNGGLTTVNLSPTAGITTGQLANPYQVETICIPVLQATYTDRRASAPVQIAICPFPGLDSAKTFTIIGCTIMTSNYGAGTATYTLNWGSYAGGTFTTVTNIFTAQAASNNLVSPTLASTTFQQSNTTQRGFQLIYVSDADTTIMNDAGDQQMVVLRVKSYLST